LGPFGLELWHEQRKHWSLWPVNFEIFALSQLQQSHKKAADVSFRVSNNLLTCSNEIWQTYVDRKGIDELIEELVQRGNILDDLRIWKTMSTIL